MLDAFKEMIAQLYQNEDFYEWVYVQGRKYKCFCSPIGNGIAYTEAGLVDEANFTLDLQLRTLDRTPSIGDEIIFRDQTYKISHIDTDSANTTIKLYLITLSKGI